VAGLINCPAGGLLADAVEDRGDVEPVVGLIEDQGALDAAAEHSAVGGCNPRAADPLAIAGQCACMTRA
jgi:hypothetical protein